MLRRKSRASLAVLPWSWGWSSGGRNRGTVVAQRYDLGSPCPVLALSLATLPSGVRVLGALTMLYEQPVDCPHSGTRWSLHPQCMSPPSVSPQPPQPAGQVSGCAGHGRQQLWHAARREGHKLAGPQGSWSRAGGGLSPRGSMDEEWWQELLSCAPGNALQEEMPFAAALWQLTRQVLCCGVVGSSRG